MRMEVDTSRSLLCGQPRPLIAAYAQVHPATVSARSRTRSARGGERNGDAHVVPLQHQQGLQV